MRLMLYQNIRHQSIFIDSLKDLSEFRNRRNVYVVTLSVRLLRLVAELAQTAGLPVTTIWVGWKNSLAMILRQICVENLSTWAQVLA